MGQERQSTQEQGVQKRKRREGHLYEEIKAIEHKGMQAFRKERNGKSNGHRPRRK